MKKYAVLIFLLTIVLSLIGLFVLYESSSYTALLNLGDRFYFIKNQAIYLPIGIVLALIVSRVPEKKLYFLSLPLLLATFILLIAVFLPGLGLELKGSHRWIDLGIIVFQPSELLKISLTIYLAAWLSSKEKGRLLAFLLLLAVFCGLVLLQPDLGTAFIITVTAISIYFLSGAKLVEMAIMGFILVVGAGFFITTASYRLERFSSFREFSIENPTDSTYHLRQIILGIGSGGLLGVGPGNSIQKYAYLPENTTDSIFAIYAEETGFIGSLFLISLFFVHALLGFLIAASSKDMFGRLLASGIVIFISIQALINLSSQAIIIPLTGVPLPFISYGGSSMLINFVAVGLLMNVAYNSKKTK